jgi:acyl-CoA synthetase (AMP-forming)/AMP-acid ligase II
MPTASNKADDFLLHHKLKEGDIEGLARRLRGTGVPSPPRVPGGARLTQEALDKRWSLLPVSPETRALLADTETVAGMEKCQHNIENFIGSVKVPVGLAGPLRVNGLFAQGDFYIPLATTEAALVASYSRGAFAMRRGNGLLAGKPIPEICLRIIQDQWGTALGSLDAGKFDAMQAPSEQIGEIVVAGDHVLKGYLRGRGNEETKFSVTGEVWHRTGDAGKFDATGRLWLMGRCAARIDDARGQLYPFAVECVANDQAGVRRAAFLEHGGARLLAIEPNDMCDINVERDLRSDLAWASIDRIIRIKKLPVDKRHNAKIDYPELRRLLKCEV